MNKKFAKGKTVPNSEKLVGDRIRVGFEITHEKPNPDGGGVYCNFARWDSQGVMPKCRKNNSR